MLRARRSARDQLDGRIDQSHRLGGLRRDPAVLRGRLVADLPVAVHLVAQAPHAHVVRLGRAVLYPLVGPVRAAGVVAVLHQLRRGVRASGAQVHRQHRRRAHPSCPGAEFVRAHLVRFDRAPGQVEPDGPLLDRADAVLPAVTGHEVPAGIADDRHAEFPGQIGDVLPESVPIGRRMLRLVDAGVDAAAEMLDERPVHPGVDGADPECGVNGDACFGHEPPLLDTGGGDAFGDLPLEQQEHHDQRQRT